MELAKAGAAIERCIGAIPEHVKIAAAAVRLDLIHGPASVVIPPEGIEHVCHDDIYLLRQDAEEAAQERPGSTVVNAFLGMRDVVTDFIDDLPAPLYYDDDADDCSTAAPEGEEIDGEYIEPCMEFIYELQRRDIVEALFRRTIAQELR